MANKAIGGLTGVSFVCARRSSVPAVGTGLPRRNIYLNLQEHLRWADSLSQTPNTPAVTMFVALDAALSELAEGGFQKRIQRYRTCADIIRSGVSNLGLRLLLPLEMSSNTVTSVFLPPQLNLSGFITELDRRGYIVYPGKGPLRDQNMFQIANMGQVQPEHCHQFLAVLRDTLHDMAPGWLDQQQR